VDLEKIRHAHPAEEACPSPTPGLPRRSTGIGWVTAGALYGGTKLVELEAETFRDDTRHR